MTTKASQGLALGSLSLMLAIFLMVHAIIVEIDFTACFENYAASINGERPYRMVEELSLVELAYAATRHASLGSLLIATFGLLSLSPFLVAWSVAESSRARLCWVVSACVAFVAIIAATARSELSDFYDCELNGMSLGVLFAPILYAAMNAIVAVGLAGLGWLLFSRS